MLPLINSNLGKLVLAKYVNEKVSNSTYFKNHKFSGLPFFALNKTFEKTEMNEKLYRTLISKADAVIHLRKPNLKELGTRQIYLYKCNLFF